MKKIVIAGGTGFLGQILSAYFSNQGYEVVVLSRGRRQAKANVSFVQWDGEKLDKWKHELEGANVLINMCGKSVDCRYTPTNKQLIYDT